jgi:hypothetical protein
MASMCKGLGPGPLWSRSVGLLVEACWWHDGRILHACGGFTDRGTVARRNVPSGMRRPADIEPSMRLLGRMILRDNTSKTGDGPEIAIRTTYGIVLPLRGVTVHVQYVERVRM